MKSTPIASKHNCALASKILLVFVITFSLLSCNNDGNDNEFQFNLNNRYRIENTGLEFETTGGFERQNNPDFNIILSDAEIDNELNSPCCGGGWDYVVNPSTEVNIVFAVPKNQLTSGVYHYTEDGALNDFSISIINQMTFNSNNSLISTNPVANTYATANEIRIASARLELLLSDDHITINYRIDTADNKRILGSYAGSLQRFNYNYCDADCD
jgi:hypothetical protein